MKKILLSVFILMFSVNVFAAKAQTHQAKEEAAIDALMTSWHKAFSNNSDIKAFSDALTDDAVLRGTDPNESMTKDQMRDWMQHNTAAEFKATKRVIHFSKRGDVAWVDEDLSSPTYWSSRAVTILEKIDGQWKIRFYSVLFAIPNASIPDIKPILFK